MRTKKQKKKELSEEQLEIVEAKDFFDRTMPGVIRFYTDHYICGNFYKSCWAVTEYPPSTEETAILAHLADRNGVTLRMYCQPQIVQKLFSRMGSFELNRREITKRAVNARIIKPMNIIRELRS